ncbi:MAG: hypothetical protein DDT42_01809 [candidate division WS2 bacterium]|uniref:Uncharacterized protein n=1 Tax=Psychracetigena formicireducens TaxID=2986056 RepID=A0A9E2F584_PSYF1|nr:hypothetical protein [Candidatus Psychracetigena formicireducens]
MRSNSTGGIFGRTDSAGLGGSGFETFISSTTFAFGVRGSFGLGGNEGLIG